MALVPAAFLAIAIGTFAAAVGVYFGGGLKWRRLLALLGIITALAVLGFIITN